MTKFSLLNLAAELILLFAGLAAIFLWSPSYSQLALSFALLAGIVQYRSIKTKLSAANDAGGLLTGILKKPGTTLLIIATAISGGGTWPFQILAGLAGIFFSLSLACGSYLLIRKRHEAIGGTLTAVIAMALLIAWPLLKGKMNLGLFHSEFLPAGWIRAVAFGDLMAFVLITVLGVWLFRMRHRFEKRTYTKT